VDFDDLQRAFFDGLYTYRIELAIAGAIVVLVLGLVAWRVGWLAAGRRHPGRSVSLAAGVLVIGLPLAWYVASPLWIRTELIEPGPAVAVDATPLPVPASDPSATPPATARPEASTAPQPTSFVARRLVSGSFHGTDDFHFGRGTATIIQTAPGMYTLRLADFSVRNGPDLFVYLSPDADDYAKGSLELGRLKATDGSFGYALPPGTDPSDFASAIIWCKQFSHLFAVAPFAAA
jgi:hypothetical protein